VVNLRSWVETILYGAGAHRRFTQDSPVLLDVWAEYFSAYTNEASDRRLNLLIKPFFDVAPAEVVSQMRQRMDRKYELTQTTYNRTVVSTWLKFEELVACIIPLTRWYSELTEPKVEMSRAAPAGARKKSRQRQSLPPLPKVGEMWEDVVRPTKPTYPYPQLLGFARMAGLIAYFGDLPDNERAQAISETESKIKILRSAIDGEQAEEARKVIAKRSAEGWSKHLKGLPAPHSKGPIYSINRNRPATFALNHSVKTVKGDAALRLFAIDSRDLTWAIIDSGIDASHPAFLDRDEPEKPEPKSALERLNRSRVKETYDFSYLEDLLLGTTQALPERYRMKKPGANKKGMEEIAQRIRDSRMVDWELLAPFLRIDHDKDYLASRPKDGHGTHVAGILAADWPRSDTDHMQGMCPNIRLIDMRVIRDDGTSNEFIIMSALQFLRYLNANSEKIYVHGANLSLSLLHDAATYGCGQTPVCEETELTVASGVVVVAAAGNLGYRRFAIDDTDSFEQYSSVTITDPGNAASVITVGSTHRIEPHTYGVSYFSSRGPTGDGRIKPDLVAPGEKIFAPTLDDSAARLDGTSMAAPHVSGAAAILMARHVELKGDPARVKHILCATATDLGRERYFQGHGLVDVLRALQFV
jgi:serine protease AprX